MGTKRVFCGLVAAVAIVGASPATTAIAADSSKAGKTESNGSSCYGFKQKERGFASEINQARQAAGLPRLNLDPELSQAAKSHTYGMVRQNDLAHTPENRLRRKVTNWTLLGENVGVGNTVQSLHAAFMASPTHKRNIMLSEFRHVGIGTIQDGNRLWVTVIFEAETNPGTTLPMPKC